MEMALTLKRQRKRPCALTAARQVIGRETTSAHRQKRKIQDTAVNREEKGLASGKGPFAERRRQIRRSKKPDGSAAKPWQGRVDVCVDRTKTL